MKKIIKISVLVLFVILVIIACIKEKSDNPTNGKTTAVFNPNVSYGTMTDQDGNVYKTITIGTQTWMAENLQTTKYRDGSAIPNIIDSTAWTNLTTGAYCNYNNTKNADTIATYGRLYNWYAATDSRNIAPSGWHVPTDTEWKTLEMFLGMTQTQADETGWRGTDQGNQLKETGDTHWYGGTNSSGFSALPGGYRSYDYGTFYFLRYSGLWWSATELNWAYAWFRTLVSSIGNDYRRFHDKKDGFSVRCLRD